MCTHRASRILVYSIPLPYMARLNGPFGLHRVKFLKEATTHSTQHANWATYTMRINGIYDCKYECEYANVNVSMRIWIWMQYSLLIQSLWLSMQSLVINLQLADSNGGFPPTPLHFFPSRYDLWPYRAAYLVVWVNETAENSWQTSWWRIISPFVKLCNYFI